MKQRFKHFVVNDPIFSTLWEVEDLYNEVMKPFDLYMPDGLYKDKIKRMIEDIDCPNNEFMTNLLEYLMEIGCPVFMNYNMLEWFNTLTQYKLKEAHLKNLCSYSGGELK